MYVFASLRRRAQAANTEGEVQGPQITVGLCQGKCEGLALNFQIKLKKLGSREWALIWVFHSNSPFAELISETHFQPCICKKDSFCTPPISISLFFLLDNWISGISFFRFGAFLKDHRECRIILQLSPDHWDGRSLPPSPFRVTGYQSEYWRLFLCRFLNVFLLPLFAATVCVKI